MRKLKRIGDHGVIWGDCNGGEREGADGSGWRWSSSERRRLRNELTVSGEEKNGCGERLYEKNIVMRMYDNSVCQI